VSDGRVTRALARTALLATLLLGSLPAASDAQVFLASRPHPDFTVGPLYVRAAVAPEMGPVTVDVFWSLVVPPDKSAADVVDGDLFLLWPSAVTPAPNLGPPDAQLVRYAEQRGFTVIEEGRLELSARNLYETNRDKAVERIPGGAPFVTLVRQGGALGLTSPATYVRIPWNPKLVNPVYLMDLRMQTKGLIKPKRGTWAERVFWGPRYRLLLSFQDVNPRTIFPLYFQNRDRVLHLAEEPAQLRLEFAKADHLKIDEISPPSSRREMSETRDNTEVVSLFLNRSAGLAPQTLTVQYGYFSDVQSWAPILIPFAFFVLGNLAAPIFKVMATRTARAVRARVHVGRPDRPQADSGTVLTSEVLERIKPGETTYEDVLRLCGPSDEEQEQRGAPAARTVVYRGHRVVPQRARTWGWVSTVHHWDMEHHEVEITVDGNVVRDVQARVRRTRLTHPDADNP
jgi:hypothetical protein